MPLVMIIGCVIVTIIELIFDINFHTPSLPIFNWLFIRSYWLCSKLMQSTEKINKTKRPSPSDVNLIKKNVLSFLFRT